MQKTASERSKERNDWLRSHGLCANCKQPIAVNSKWYCADCLQKQADWHHDWYFNLTPEEKAEYRRKQYACRDRKKAAKICTNCQRPASPGKTRCLICADRINKKARERYAKNKVYKD